MRWSIDEDLSIFGDAEGEFEERTDAIKERNKRVAERRITSMVAAITYEEPKPPEDPRLEKALARLDALAEKEERKQQVEIVVSSDKEVQEALIATINQISERMENGERVTESLVASLHTLAAQPPPMVTVNVPEQAAPVVNVAAPEVQMPEIVIPEIRVPEINVSVPATEVTVMMPEERKRSVTFTRDPLDGRLQSAEITEE